MRSARAVLAIGVLAAAIGSAALSAQTGGSDEPQATGSPALADLARPAVFGGDSVPDLVVAPGSGAQPTRVFSGAGFGLLGAGFPFNPNFAGGVRVAVGDINGDGVGDVVAGQGPGGSLVTLINGASITVIGSGHPFGAGFRGGVHVATADVNADGMSDIVLGQGDGGGRVMVFSGADISLLMNFAPFGPSFRGGVTVAAGDLNGDGRADIIAGQASGGAVSLVDGATQGVIISAPVYGPGGVFVAAGDVNGDGRADIILAPGAGNSPVLVYDLLTLSQLTAFVAYPPGHTGGVRVAAADFNGDGRAEIVTGPGPGSGSTVRVFSGGTFAPLASFEAYGPGFNGGVFVAAPSLRSAARFTSAAAATFTVGQAGTFTVRAAGAPPVTTITQAGALPAGVTFTNNGDGTATLSGTPTAPGGSFPLTFSASNGVGAPAVQAFSLTVNQPPAITSANATSFVVGLAGSFTVTTTGFPAPQIARTGALPGGVTFTDNGNGTATLAGTPLGGSATPYPLNLTATNGVGEGDNQTFNLTVESACSSITLSPPAGALSQATVGSVYNLVFSATPTSTYTFSVTGALPTGLMLPPAGALTGTPTSPGLFNFTITATSSAGCTGTAAYTLDVVPNADAQNDTFLGAVGNTQFSVGAGPLPTPHVLVGGSVLDNDAGAGARTVTAGSFPTATPGGNVVIAANGTFVYTPPAGFSGSDSFTYTMTDGNGQSDNATVTVGVGTPVWYVDAAAGSGDGRSHSPFNNMTDAVGISLAGQAIYVHASAPAGSTVLKAGQTLAGAGATFVFGNLTIPGSINPTLGGTITLADNVLVSGLTVSTGGSDAIVATNVNGAVTLSQVAITSGSTGVLINGGTATMNIGATIANTTVRSVSVQNKTDGTITFSGAITDNAQGILLNANPNTTIAFTGGMNVNTGDFPAFTATNGGTVVATQNNLTIVNTLASATSTALTVVGTRIGAAGLTFRSIDAGTAAPTTAAGIVLDNTGTDPSNGGLTVVGNGALPTGGRIRNKTGPDGSTSEGLAIYLNNTKAPSFRWMQFLNLANSAIFGQNVFGFTLEDSEIGEVGGAQIGTTAGINEGPVVFGALSPTPVNGIVGTATLRNNIIMGGVEHNLTFYNHSGSMTVLLQGVENGLPQPVFCEVKNPDVAGGDGVHVEVSGTAVGTVTVSGCRMGNNLQQGFDAIARDTSSLTVVIEDSHVVGSVQGTDGIVLVNEDDAQLTTRIERTEITDVPGMGIFVGQTPGSATASSLLQATLRDNTIRQPAAIINSAIVAGPSSTAGQLAQTRILLERNFIEGPGTFPGILVRAQDASSTPLLDATLLDNTIYVHSSGSVPGVSVLAGPAGAGTDACANLLSNDVRFFGDPPVVAGLRLSQAASATLQLEQGASEHTDPLLVLLDNNDASNTAEVLGTVSVAANGTCQLPSAP